MKLLIVKLNPTAIVPTRAYGLDSGIDLYSIPDTDEIILKSGERKLVGTGIAIQLPSSETIDKVWGVDGTRGRRLVYEAQVRSKSGLALKQGLIVLNSPGTIDNQYSGEIGIILFNTSNKDIVIKPGQKIAQLVVCPVVIPELEVVDEFEMRDRESNGFGSTGI